MPPITLSPISNSVVKVRWKEPYASEGLNRKMAVVVPAGVYRGLNLGVSASNLSIELSADAVGDHVAVQESSNGFSTTYADDTSGAITLDLSGFATNDVVVVCLTVGYAVGSTTTAEFRGYELSEYEALGQAARDSLVVLGTVLRPAAGIIPIANITHDRRTLPFLRRTDEATPWNPLLRNGGFELGHTNATYPNASPFWTTYNGGNANFTIRPVSTEAHSGAKSLELTTSVAGAVTATIWQDLYMPVTPGRFIMGRLYKKAIQAATLSSGRIRFIFGDLNGTNDVQEDLVFAVDAVDGAFVEFSGIIKVPITARVLKGVYIVIAGTYAGTGPCIRIDGVQAWAQVDASNWADVLDARTNEGAFSRLMLGQANSFSTNSAKLSFSGTILEIERQDASQTAVPPALSIPGRSFLNGIRYTLLFQSAIPTTVPPNVIYYRKYVSSLNFSVVETINASFDNGTLNWSKDMTGFAVEATKHEVAYGGVRIYGRSGSVADDAPWADSSWKQYSSTAVPEITTTLNQKFAPILQVKDQGGNRKTIVDHNGLMMGRQTVLNELWWQTNAGVNGATVPVGWSQLENGAGGYTIGDYGIARLDAGASVGHYNRLKTFNTSFIPTNDSNLIVTAEWEFSPNQVNIILPQCGAVMGFFGNGPGGGGSSEGVWIGCRETDTNWQFASQFGGGSGLYWADAAGAFGGLVNTGVPVTSGTTRMRIEIYGAHASFGTARALAYINGSLVGEIPAADLPAFYMGWGMEIVRAVVSGTRSISVGPLKIVHNRRVRSDDVL